MAKVVLIRNPSGEGNSEFSLTPDSIGAAPDMSVITKEATGFSSPESVVINYDPATQKVTLTGTTTAYWRNTLVAVLTSGWVSEAHANTTGHFYFLYYDGVNFVWNTDTFPGFDKLLICYVHYGVDDKFAIRECHGLMEWQCHEEFHEIIGTFKESGGTLSGYALSSTTATERRPSVSQCVVQDEDLLTTLPALSDNGPYTTFFLTSTGVIDYTVDYAEIIPVLTARPYYNQFSTPNWVQTLMPANSVATVWLMAIPVTSSVASQKYRFVWIQPQWITQASSSFASALLTARNAERLRSPGELSFGSFSVPEFVLLARVTIQYTGSNWTIENITNLSGSRYSQTGTPSGNYLSSVITDSTLTGNGTVSTPLSVLAIKSNTTTGVMQIVGPVAESTYVATVPDANWTAARTDQGQILNGFNIFTNNSASIVNIRGYCTDVTTNNQSEYNGEFTLGSTAAYQGRFSFGGAKPGEEHVFYSNTYDAAGRGHIFRVRTSGTPINVAKFDDTGLTVLAGRMIVDDPTDASNSTNGSIQTDGGLSTAKAAYIGGILKAMGGSSIGITFRSGTINTEDYDGLDTLSVNFKGYLNGTTQFRNFNIYDGKGAQIVAFTGTDKLATFKGRVVTNDATASIDRTTGSFVTGGGGGFGGRINATGWGVYGGNEVNIVDLCTSGTAYIGYRGATDTITAYRFCSGKADSVLAKIYSAGLDSSESVTIASSKGLLLANGAFHSSTLTTSATTINQTLDTFPSTTYRSARYQIQMTAGTAYQSIEIHLIHDGSTVYKTTYGKVSTSVDLATFDATVSGGNVILLTTPVNAITVYKLVRISVNA